MVLLFAVSWVLLQGVGEGLLVSLAGGLILDILSGAPFGIMMISLTLTSELAGLGESNIFRGARFLPYIVIGLATILYRGALLVLLRMTGYTIAWWPMVPRFVFSAIVLNVLLMPIVYKLVKSLCSRIQPERAEWE